MANTVTQRTLQGSGSDKNVFRLIHILSDGTAETDLVIYDNSAFVSDVSKGSLMQAWFSSSTGVIARLEWDQTADSPAISFYGAHEYMDFRNFGGITNPNGTGATGDLVLSTTGFSAGNELTVIIHIRQQ